MKKTPAPTAAVRHRVLALHSKGVPNTEIAPLVGTSIWHVSCITKATGVVSKFAHRVMPADFAERAPSLSFMKAAREYRI